MIEESFVITNCSQNWHTVCVSVTALKCGFSSRILTSLPAGGWQVTLTGAQYSYFPSPTFSTVVVVPEGEKTVYFPIYTYASSIKLMNYPITASFGGESYTNWLKISY